MVQNGGEEGFVCALRLRKEAIYRVPCSICDLGCVEWLDPRRREEWRIGHGCLGFRWELGSSCWAGRCLVRRVVRMAG